MISGSRKLSNRAASDRKMMISAKAKVTMKPPTLLDVLARGAAVVDRVALRQGPRRELLQGLQRLALRHAGKATPWMVALLSCWKWFSDCGIALVTILARPSTSGTDEPSAARM